MSKPVHISYCRIYDYVQPPLNLVETAAADDRTASGASASDQHGATKPTVAADSATVFTNGSWKLDQGCKQPGDQQTGNIGGWRLGGGWDYGD